MSNQYREHVRGVASSVLSGLRDIRDVQGDAFRLDVAIEVIHELMIERLRAGYRIDSTDG